MIQGRIVKALSGFYYVQTGEGILSSFSSGWDFSARWGYGGMQPGKGRQRAH